MPASFATIAHIPVFRRNPARVPTRNFLVMSSDAPVLACTFWQTDSDTVPLDVSDAVFQISLFRDRVGEHWPWWDYGLSVPCGGYSIATIKGVSVDPTNGRVDFPLAADWRAYHRARLRFELAMTYPVESADGTGVFTTDLVPPNYAQGSYTVLTGIIEYQGGARIVAPPAQDLLSNIAVP